MTKKLNIPKRPGLNIGPNDPNKGYFRYRGSHQSFQKNYTERGQSRSSASRRKTK